MSSASRRESRKFLMRTAATALIAASPFVYSGASAATTSDNVQLTAPVLKDGKIAKQLQVYSLASASAAAGNFQLNAPIFQGGKIANDSLLFASNFNLAAPTLQGANAFAGPRLASQPVQNLLAVPMDARAGDATISASAFSISTMAVVAPISETATGTDPINISNPDDIVDAPSSAIEATGEDGNVIISNSGDISGVNGIIATTGAANANRNDATLVASDLEGKSYDYSTYAWVYDQDGNFVPNPNIWTGNYYKTEFHEVTDIFDMDANTSDAKLAIDNSGRVAFSGLYGIKASNEAGDSIDITNSGDIASTNDTYRRVGILADTTAPLVTYSEDDPVLTQPGDFTYDSQGRLLQGFTPTVYEQSTTMIRMANDDGSLRIENSGTIDMGNVVLSELVMPDGTIGLPDGQLLPFYAVSEGITAIGANGLEIINSGTVKVGDFSRGITAVADGGIYVLNSGGVEIGNKSTGIAISSSHLYGYQIGDAYRHGGDNLIVNSGDITGGLTTEEALASENAAGFLGQGYAVGIKVDVRNSNNEYYARSEQWADEQAYYAGIFGEQYFPPSEHLNAHNYTTTVRNEGNIILKDGGRGIDGTALYGELRAINAGTIQVGDGYADFEGNSDVQSAGIRLSNFNSGGISDLYAKNEAGGIIVTGDMGVGMVAQNWYGNKATVINDGSITVGNGVVGDDHVTDTHVLPYVEAVIDRPFKSVGMEGVARGVQHSYVYMRNSGDLHAGDLSLGMRMYANSTDFYVQGRSAGLAYNEGDIAVGKNAIGIQASGSRFVVANGGTITTGDRDLSGYRMHEYTEDSFKLTGIGIWATSNYNSIVVNDECALNYFPSLDHECTKGDHVAQIITGNGTIGIYHGANNGNHFNYSSVTIQGENGIVSTGDDSIGMKTHSGLYNDTRNYGTISVGDDSVGIEASAGFNYTQLLETIQYGGCHEINYNGGAGCTADTITTGYSYDFSEPNDYDNIASKTKTEFTQEVSRPGLVSVNNAGIIETGDKSVGVRLAGLIGLEYEHTHFVSLPIADDPSTPEDESDRFNIELRKEGVVNTNSYVFFSNSGTVRVGTESTAVEITGRGQRIPTANPVYDAENPVAQPSMPNPDYDPDVDPPSSAYIPNPVYDPENPIAQRFLRDPNYDPSDVNSNFYVSSILPQMINYGTIDAGQGVAISANVGNGIDLKIYNAGTIIGDIIFGDGDDLLFHGQDIDPASGQVLGTGNIIMDGDNTIDFGGGENRFHIQRGVISVTGDDNVITGDNLTVEMVYGEIDARDDFIVGAPSAVTLAATPLASTANFSTLTINGDVSGNFHFAADVDASGASDHLIINGDVLEGSEIGVLINPVEQLKGEIEWRPINIGGTNDADLVEVFGVTGLYADSVIDSEAHYDAATGDIIINATFGLGHMGTAANAAAISAGNWLTGTLSGYGKRNIHAYTGRKGDGLAVWGYAFQDEGRIHPDSKLQDLSFSEISTGMQAGVQWSKDVAGGRVSVSPMFTYGTVEANLIANSSSSRGHPWAAGINANYVLLDGFYLDATYQHMSMDVDLKTPQTLTRAKGEAKITGNGFNVEAGYSHKLASGLTIEPQLQLTHVNVDMDDFRSSDDIYELSDIDGKSTTLRAGVSVYKVFETTNGAITPMASLSYVNALNGKTQLASNGVDFDNDTSGAGYKAEIGLLGRYHAWDFAGKIGVSNTSATGSILQPNFTARYALGGAAKAPAKTAAAAQLPEVTEATVKFAEAGTSIAPLATAASAEDGAPVVSAAYAQTGAEPVETAEKKEEQPQQTSPELAPEPTAEDPMVQSDEPAADEVADEVSDIVVTGSLIRRSTATEATPITVVTSEDMAERGLMTLGEVMQSFTQNEGYVQGKASNLLGRFTFGAEEINFRGLGAGRTLVLVNGRRIADYPLPFGGEQNGVDLGTIPYSAIAKVEYLSAGASATYGSDAVGGVVNFITKRDMEQTSLELTGGLYQQGFGETGRIAAITGNSFERGSFTIGAEGFYSGEILASDAKYFRKNAPFNAGMIDILENTAGGQASVLPESACAPLGFEFSTGQCTSNVSDTISLSPKTKQGSAFFDGRYDLTDRIELFGTAMGSIGKSESRSNVLFWQGVVANEDETGAMFVTRGFSEDELGISTVTVDNNMWTVVAGAKGGIDVGGGTWYWDVAASHASFHTKQTGRNLKEEGVKNWILNGAASVADSPDQRYTYFVDPDFYNNQLIDNIVRPVQPSDVDSLVGDNVMKANSSAQSLTATLNGTFSDLGFLYKPVKFAVRAEYGRQVTEINPDDRTLNTSGEGWFNIGTIEAKGKRSRWALAAEVDTSVLSNLDVVLAGRYDHYYDDSSITGRFTGQAKFLYRPTDWLKVRGGYGQTFRAPDMFNIYGRSDGFEFVPDFSAPGCFDGSTYTCGQFQIASTRQADPGLKEEHGDDLGLGIIVNPLPGFQFTVDWYNIHLKDLVLTESSYDLVLKEWQCANGVLDGSSALCDDVNNRVIRNGFGALERVIVQPINSANLTRSGIDIQASYGFESAKLGSFNFNLGYSRVLKFELTRFKGDAPIDLKYGEPGSATPGNNLNFGANWFQPLTTGKGIAAGLFVQRTGRVYNFDQSQFLEPFYDVNLSAAYQLNTKTSVRLNINNVLNTKPQENGSGFWPYYWAHLQTANALGRSAYVSLTHSFN